MHHFVSSLFHRSKIPAWLLAAGMFMHPAAFAEPLSVATGPYITSTLFYIAEENGYFARENIQVRLSSCPGAFQCMRDMLDGKVQLAAGGDLAVMFNSLERQDFSVLATHASSTAIIKILARKDANIRKPKDFIGKRIGYIRKSAPHYYLHLYLLTAGIDPALVKQVPLEQTRLTGALDSREVDAIFTYEPLASRQREELGKLVVDVPLPSTYNLSTHIVAMSSFVATHETEIVRFLRALYRAEQFINREPEKARLIWMKYSKANLSDADAAWKSTSFKLALDASLVTTLRASARWAKNAGLAEGRDIPDFSKVINPAPLRQVRQEKVLQ